MRVGLTGGIGSGKSTVSGRLAELGAIVIDADALAREVVAVGTPGLAAIAQRFGVEVLAADGSLNRPRLGSIVFADPVALADLNAITHPLVRRRGEELEAAAPEGSVVVHDVPLLVESRGGGGFDEVVVVFSPLRIRIERLIARGMTEDAVRARIASQATDEQRAAVATVLLDNSGSREDLLEQVEALWHRIS